jgi:hypothetical protein
VRGRQLPRVGARRRTRKARARVERVPDLALPVLVVRDQARAARAPVRDPPVPRADVVDVSQRGAPAVGGDRRVDQVRDRGVGVDLDDADLRGAGRVGGVGAVVLCGGGGGRRRRSGAA